MQIDQLHRQLKSDPDNVELARQLWNALLREQIPAELADIDVTDPSLKNWKAILKLVNTSPKSLQPLLVEVLKPILRSWPMGIRTYIRNKSAACDYSIELTIESGASALMDTIEGLFSQEDLATWISTDHTELKQINSTSYTYNFRDFEHNLPDAEPARNPFPRIEKIVTSTQDSLYQWLSSGSPAANATLLNLRDVTLIQSEQWWNPQIDLPPTPILIQQLLTNGALRKNLNQLSIQIHGEFPNFFDLQWPALEQLVIDLRFISDFKYPSSNDLASNFPNLKTIHIDLSHKANDLQSYKQRLEVCTPIYELCQQLVEPTISLALDVETYTQSSPAKIQQLLIQKSTEFKLDCSSGHFIPHDARRLRHLVVADEHMGSYRLTAVQFADELSIAFPNLDTLTINSHLYVEQVLCHPNFTQLKSLKALEINLFEPDPSVIKEISDNLKKMNIETLRLYLTSEDLHVADEIEFPQSMRSLELLADIELVALKKLLKRSKNLHMLHIENAEDYGDDMRPIFDLLRLPNCRSIRELKLRTDRPRFEVPNTADDIRLWQWLNLTELKTLRFRYPHGRTEDKLINSFPSLINVGY